MFEDLAPKHEAVIHICIGSEFSSCYQNAVLAAQNFQNVYVADSRSLSSGSGYIVYDAALMARDGVKPQEICHRLNALSLKMDTSFVIDRLDYLHKGGRCSGLEALGARILQLKPCIEVVGGKMRVGKKYMGAFENCLDKYVRDRLSGKQEVNYKRIFITHSMCPAEIVSQVRKAILNYVDFESVIETKAGCVISNHCGPKTLGIIFSRL